MPKSRDGIIYRGISKRTGEEMWLVRVVVGTDPNGSRKYVCQTVHGGIRQAQKVQRELAAKRDQGQLEARSKETLNAYLDRWLITHKAAVKARTYLNDTEMLDRYIRPHIGSAKLHKLTPLMIQEVYATLQQSGLSPSTIRRAHAVLRNALNWAVQWQAINSNPADRVRLPKIEKKEFRPLTPEEARRFLDECAYDRYGTLFQFLLFTGCRPGEAFALRWKDIDFDNRTVSIRQTYAKKNGQELISAPKTKKGNRTIPILNESLMAELRSMRAKKIEDNLSNGQSFDDESLVFTSTSGGPVDSRNLIQRHFKPLLERAGIPSEVRLYDLRHSTATLLLALNVHPKIVQEMLGHSDIKLTMDTYTHVLPSLQQTAAAKLADLLANRS
ncbi:MAG: tyrosine-type recombinase/integrase [Alicyclobacillus sp.]|nr:tyrosine-type recombinase/integrase [Alicyclobacillus sp.]